MADAFTITGTGDIVFGTTEIGYTTIGTIVSGGRKKTGDVRELQTRKGNVYLKIYFNERDECEIEAIFDSGYTLPSRGAVIDLMGLEDLLVDEWDLKWDNKQEKMITLRCSKHTALTLDT